MKFYSLIFGIILLSTHGILNAQDNLPLQGFLPIKELPNGVELLPEPPNTKSALYFEKYKQDMLAADKAQKLYHSPRWEQAKNDANLKFPEGANVYSCAIGITINQETTPNLYQLLQRSLLDAAKSTTAAKNYYQRKRPFLENKSPICTPDDQEALTASGSYPSGHGAVGWVWAFILKDIAPNQTTAILNRAETFSESRVICNVHWKSDVAVMPAFAALIVAKLNNQPEFIELKTKAQQEYSTEINKNRLQCE